MSGLPWKVTAGLWVDRLAPYEHMSSHKTAASAMNKAAKLIKENRSKGALALSPVIVSGPIGVAMHLYLDEDGKIRRK